MSERLAGRALLAATGLLCASCMVGPDYKSPVPVAPSGWPQALEGGVVEDAAAAAATTDVGQTWWKTLGDPLLDDLIARAIAGNTDVGHAIAQVRVARAARSGASAALFPDLDATVDYQRRQSPGTTVSPTSSREFNDYSVGFDSAWEIDLFGGLRRSNEKAAAELEAAGADLREVLISVLAEVARNYVEVRSLQARLTIATDNVRSQRDTADLVRWRFQAGLANALDVDQAEYNLAETRSRVPALETELAAARNRIAVLTGASAGSLDAELATAGPIPSPPANVTVGLPADLLRRRPDVAAAERRLAAATAAVGVATADLYPSLSLSGSFTIAATDVAALDSAAARGFSVGPTLRWNLFDAGRLRSVVAERSAQADAALADWQAAVLAAYEETANALVAYAREQERRDRLAEARAAARKAQELARAQYQNGLVDFQRVLEAERAVFGFEESLAVSEAEVVTDLVALYKALGGGWKSVECRDDGCS